MSNSNSSITNLPGDAPGIRSFAKRKESAATYVSSVEGKDISGKSYKELVAERENEQRQREKKLDMNSWTKPKEGILKEGTLEVMEGGKGTKRSWDKRWFLLTKTHLYSYKTKKNDVPVAVIELAGCRIDPTTEQDKSNIFQLIIGRGYIQGTVQKNIPITLATETVDEFQNWVTEFETHIKIETEKKEKDLSSSDGSKSGTMRTSEDEHWFSRTETRKQVSDPSPSPSSSPSPSTPSSSRSSTVSQDIPVPVDKTSSAHSESKPRSDTSNKEVSFKPATPVKKDPTRKSVATKEMKKRTTSEASTPLTVEPQQKKPVLYFNLLIGGGNAASILCEKYNLEILRHPVHTSWILDAYSTPKSANSQELPSNSDVKKKFKGPKFLNLSPKKKLPLLVNENDQPTFAIGNILRSLCVGPLKEELYPPTLTTEINSILDGWEIEPIFEKIFRTVFDKLQDPTGQYKPNFTLALSFVSKIEDLLKKNSNGYLCSFTDKPTLADLYVYGYLVPLKIMNFNFGESYSLINNWFSSMEKQYGTYLSRDIQDLLDEYGKLFSTLV